MPVEKQNEYFRIIEDCHNVVTEITEKVSFISRGIPLSENCASNSQTELEARLSALRDRLLSINADIFL